MTTQYQTEYVRFNLNVVTGSKIGSMIQNPVAGENSETKWWPDSTKLEED